MGVSTRTASVAEYISVHEIDDQRLWLSRSLPVELGVWNGTGGAT
jgi:hypothetical protein